MFTKSFSPRRSLLDKAIVLSVAAMLAMNAFVLTQQQIAPVVASAPVAPATGAA